MWYEINTKDDMRIFMDKMLSFHDSCIKEMLYLSGAYVSNNLSMFPLNNRRVLRVVIQRQYKSTPMIEMEFRGLKVLKLFPVDERYTCEISDSTLIMKNGNIYWCDCGGLSEADLENYSGTLICASKLRWRPIEGRMGENEFYNID